ncbi:ubiquinone biosynthesis O-methyltransferase, mitochondrial [Athalia rosae]|uniref:ubiquinone biosynthesis O-methyltransferase, mitochondrial n=1 Tax=Athalia rosae TaxID=37344 RepID=UPI002033B3BA|nr:ubiquinone biosynthesis O-methyltransferase, mitochondrial [Athalia rosae]
MRSIVLRKSFSSDIRKCLYSTTQSIKGPNEPPVSKNTTIDAENVQLHGKMSNQWWNLDGGLRALHAMNTLRVQFIRDGLANTGVAMGTPSKPLDKIKILDVGCGGGILSEPLARIGADVTGIDASTDLIKNATEHAAIDSDLADRLRYINTCIEEHSEIDAEKYDAVVASEVLEHVADQERFLKCCTRATKPGGSLFLSTLNRTLPSWLGGIIAAEYLLRIVPIGTHDWNKFISPNEVRRLIESQGCQTKLIHGMCYNPLKNKWSWTSSTAVNYALHAVKRKEPSH